MTLQTFGYYNFVRKSTFNKLLLNIISDFFNTLTNNVYKKAEYKYSYSKLKRNKIFAFNYSISFKIQRNRKVCTL